MFICFNVPIAYYFLHTVYCSSTSSHPLSETLQFSSCLFRVFPLKAESADWSAGLMKLT